MEGNFFLRSFQVGFFFLCLFFFLSFFLENENEWKCWIPWVLFFKPFQTKCYFINNSKISQIKKAGLQIWLEQCQESVELKTYWEHWGNKSSWGKRQQWRFPGRHRRLTYKETNRKCAAATCSLFVLMSSLVYVHDSFCCRPKYTLRVFLMLVCGSQQRRTDLKNTGWPHQSEMKVGGSNRCRPEGLKEGEGQNQHGKSRCENIQPERLWFAFCASHLDVFSTAATSDED